MSELESTPKVDVEEEEPSLEEIEVVAHSDEELPCGGFVCGVFGQE